MTLRERMRQLSAQSLIYGLSGALTKVVGLIMVPLLWRIFRPAEYAVIDLVVSFSTLLGSVLLLGSDAAVGYYFYRQPDEESKRVLLSTWMYFQFALNALAGVVLFGLADPVSRLVLGASAHNDLYIQLIALVFPLSSTFAFALEVLRLQMRPQWYLLISAVNVIAGLVLTLVLVVALRLGLTGVYVATACTNVFAFGAALWAIGGSLVPRFSGRVLRAVLAYGVPLVPISLSSWAIGMSNRFFIRGHSGITDVGLFSSGNKVAQIMFLAVTAFALAWGPFAFSIAEEPDAKRTYAKVLTFYVAVLGWLALALSLFAPLILALGRPAYMRGYQVVPPLTLSYLIAGAYYIVAVGTSLSRKTIHLSWTTAAGGIVALLANVLLLPVPYFALVGGALATLCGNLVWVALVYWVSQRLYPIPYELKRVLTCVCILVTLVLLGQIARGYVQPTSPVGLLVRLALTGSYPFLLVFAGVIERYEVKVLHGAVWSRIRQRLIASRL